MAATSIEISEARRRLSSLDDELKESRVIYVTRHNRNAFAVMDLDYLEALFETVDVLSDPQAAQLLRESLADIEAGRLIDHENLP